MAGAAEAERRDSPEGGRAADAALREETSKVGKNPPRVCRTIPTG